MKKFKINKKLVIITLIVSMLFGYFNLAYAERGIGFGGKVRVDKIPGVQCQGNGTLVLLSTNVGGIVQAVTSQFSGNTGEKIAGGAGGAYKAIPFYVPASSKPKPKKGGWILGIAEISPDLSVCELKTTINDEERSLPFPVRNVLKYGTSN